MNLKPLIKFLKSKPNGTWNDYCASVKDPGMSDVTFYKYRKEFRTGTLDEGNTNESGPETDSQPEDSVLPEGLYQGAPVSLRKRMDKVARLMIDNEDFTFAQCAKNGLHIKDHQYYRVRKALIQAGLISDQNYRTYQRKESQPRKRNSMYVSVFTFPSEDVPDKAKNILKEFVASLGVSHKLKLEVVEYADPAQIEIREIH